MTLKFYFSAHSTRASGNGVPAVFQMVATTFRAIFQCLSSALSGDNGQWHGSNKGSPCGPQDSLLSTRSSKLNSTKGQRMISCSNTKVSGKLQESSGFKSIGSKGSVEFQETNWVRPAQMLNTLVGGFDRSSNKPGLVPLLGRAWFLESYLPCQTTQSCWKGSGMFQNSQSLAERQIVHQGWQCTAWWRNH